MVTLTSAHPLRRRELALLLLEDPGHRLRTAHCDEIMRARLPEAYRGYSDAAADGSCGQLLGCASGGPIHAALCRDPICESLFRLERPGEAAIPVGCGSAGAAALFQGTASPASASPSSSSFVSGGWPQLLLRLDAAELARCCSWSHPGEPSSSPTSSSPHHLPGSIAAAAAAAAPPTAGLPTAVSPRQQAMQQMALGGTVSPGLPKFLFEYEAPMMMPGAPAAPAGSRPNQVQQQQQQSQLGSATQPLVVNPIVRRPQLQQLQLGVCESTMGPKAIAIAFGSLVHRPGGTSLPPPPPPPPPQLQPHGSASNGNNQLLASFGSVGSVGSPQNPGPQLPQTGGLPAGGSLSSHQSFSPPGGAGTPLFSYVPKEISSCWGGGPPGFGGGSFGGSSGIGSVFGGADGMAAGAAQQQQQHSSFPSGPHLMAGNGVNAGFGYGSGSSSVGGHMHAHGLRYNSGPSPSSALDVSSAMLGGSHGSSGCGEMLSWPSSSPEVDHSSAPPTMHHRAPHPSGTAVGAQQRPAGGPQAGNGGAPEDASAWLLRPPAPTAAAAATTSSSSTTALANPSPLHRPYPAFPAGSGAGGVLRHSGASSEHLHLMAPSAAVSASHCQQQLHGGSAAAPSVAASEGAESCSDFGVLGPPDLDSSLEAMLSFDSPAAPRLPPPYSGPRGTAPAGGALPAAAAAAAAAGGKMSFAAAASSSSSSLGVPPPPRGGQHLRSGSNGSSGSGAATTAATSLASNPAALDPASATGGVSVSTADGAALKGVMTGWAAVAAREPATTAVAAAAAWKLQQQQLQHGGGAGGGGAALSPSLAVSAAPRLATTHSRVSPRLQAEIAQLVASVPGLKVSVGFRV